MKDITSAPDTQNAHWGTVRKVVYIIGSVLLFIFALDLMISSLQELGSSTANTIIQATADPFTGLFIGLLITAMIQSSSTTTSMVVALVASGSISIEHAIPIIMGANVGTTITSTVVSLGFVNKKNEFRRAVAAGTYHDFFNILTVVILFPLEYFYGFLSTLSTFVAHQFFHPGGTIIDKKFTHLLPGVTSLIDFLVENIPNRIVLVVFSAALLLTSILVFRQLISRLFMARSPQRFSTLFFKSKLKAFSWGIFTTALIRSSTVTTSLVVPLVAKKVVTLQKASPFLLGANIGTTITAFIAALLNSSTASSVSLALAHFFFNLLGVLIFLFVPGLQQVPILLARYLGKATYQYRPAGFIYLLLVFFVIPFLLIYLHQN